MKRLLLYLLVICFLFACGTKKQVSELSDAQIEDNQLEEFDEMEEGVFAYVQKRTRRGSRGGSAVNNDYRIKVVESVLKDLIRARGEFRMQKPSLVMKNQEKLVAWMNSIKVEVGMEFKAYDVCKSMGKDSLNAIAALLGHEVTHYYDKHSWARHFAKENADVQTFSRVNGLSEKIRNETQADYLGGFLAYSAGYNSLGVMPVLLEKLYEAYNLPSIINGYPNLEERLSIAENSMTKLSELAGVFDMAVNMSLVKHNEWSKEYYKYVLKDFQSREIYNNLGVSQTLDALTEISHHFKYYLPLEIDGSSRITQFSRGATIDSAVLDLVISDETFDKLMEALDNFETAALLDKDYIPARLNMACVNYILSSIDEAENHLNKARLLSQRQNNTALVQSIDLMSALIDLKREREQEARKKLERLTESGSALASRNLKILNKVELEIGVGQSNPLAETIDGVFLEDEIEDLDVDSNISINSSISFGIKKLNNSKLYVHLVSHTDEFFVFQTTEDNYVGKTALGIQIGDQRTDVIKEYGASSAILQSGSHFYEVYDQQKIVFKYGSDQILKSWSVYLSNEDSF